MMRPFLINRSVGHLRRSSVRSRTAGGVLGLAYPARRRRAFLERGPASAPAPPVLSWFGRRVRPRRSGRLWNPIGSRGGASSRPSPRAASPHTSNPFDAERYEAVRAVAVDMLADRTGGGPEAILGLFAQDRGYATPKVDVRGAVFEDDRLLMVKEDLAGGWAVPGGWAEINEPPAGASSGRYSRSRATPPRRASSSPSTTVSSTPKHRIPGTATRSSSSATRQAAWPRRASRPPKWPSSRKRRSRRSLSPRSPRDQLAHVFEHHRNPERPADFD